MLRVYIAGVYDVLVTPSRIQHTLIHISILRHTKPIVDGTSLCEKSVMATMSTGLGSTYHEATTLHNQVSTVHVTACFRAEHKTGTNDFLWASGTAWFLSASIAIGLLTREEWKSQYWGKIWIIPAVHLLAALTANLFIEPSLLVLSVVVISVGKIPGRMQLTRILMLEGVVVSI